MSKFRARGRRSSFGIAVLAAAAVVASLAFLGAASEALGDAGLVSLSGVVRDGSGAGVAGTTVSYGGGSQVSTVTGADGSYLLHLLPNDGGTLRFVADEATQAPLQRMTAITHDYFFSGSGDPLAVDLTWPAHARLRATVVDTNSNPLPGVVVNESQAQEIQTTLSDGSPILIRADPPDSGRSCTTDNNGQCYFDGLVGQALFLHSSRALVPGDPSYPTVTVANATYLTTDPTDTTLTFRNLASFQSNGAVVGSVVAGSPDGTSMENASNQPVSGNAVPSGATVLTGALTYEVDGLTPGGSIDVTLVLPDGSDPTNVYKLRNGNYVDVASIATISGDTITLHLTDGGPQDADGLANGVIVDPVIPARRTVPSAPTIGPVTAGDGSASVTFVPPDKNGGSPILDYTATCTSSDGGASSSATAAGSPVAVTGLTNGRTYTCTVSARNEAGASAPSTESNSFKPGAPSSVLDYTGPTSASPGADITLSASLKTSSGKALSAKTVTFILNGKTFSATTNKTGVASVNTKAPANPSSYPILISFAGDKTNPQASASATLAVSKLVSVVSYTGATVASPNADITLSAILKTSTGQALPAKTVTFALNGKTLSATTNKSGVASVKIRAPKNVGSYSIVAAFAGDAIYNSSSVTANLTIN
jgi:hypothetical protein